MVAGLHLSLPSRLHGEQGGGGLVAAGGRVCDVFSAKDIDGSLCGFPLGRNTMVNRYGEQVAGWSRKINTLSVLGQYLTAKGRLCWKAKGG